jgi:hypothetical protein
VRSFCSVFCELKMSTLLLFTIAHENA